jgi:hypothetical protein
LASIAVRLTFGLLQATILNVPPFSHINLYIWRKLNLDSADYVLRSWVQRARRTIYVRIRARVVQKQPQRRPSLALSGCAVTENPDGSGTKNDVLTSQGLCP